MNKRFDVWYIRGFYCGADKLEKPFATSCYFIEFTDNILPRQFRGFLKSSINSSTDLNNYASMSDKKNWGYCSSSLNAEFPWQWAGIFFMNIFNYYLKSGLLTFYTGHRIYIHEKNTLFFDIKHLDFRVSNECDLLKQWAAVVLNWGRNVLWIALQANGLIIHNRWNHNKQIVISRAKRVRHYYIKTQEYVGLKLWIYFEQIKF